MAVSTRVLTWTLFVLVGCVEPTVTSCPTVDCPFDEVCDGRGGCAKQAALDVCRGQADGAMCSYEGTPLGQCSGELCLPVGCGNYFVTPGEVCDDGNTTNGDGCSADCKSDETCSNGTVDPSKGEQCDDGNLIDGDGCQQDCKNPRCGDGTADAVLNEQCDEAELNSMAPDAACRPNCQLVRCGDGVQDTGEICDDGNVTSGDNCAGDCKSTEICGNGTIDVIKGELCDDGNQTGGDGCSADCRSTEACGNGVLDAPRGEVCDDGNIVSGDGCSSDCRSLEVCGNMVVDTIDEQCDLGMMANSDLPNSTCRTNCRLPSCGDDILDDGLGELCDDGTLNSNVADRCRLNCQVPRCGDSIQDTLEVCDDGNSTSGDNCSADCRSLETCQNGILDAAKGEQCDDGNAVGTDACRNDCTLPVCGDGRLDPFEACDLGMANSNAPNAMCRANCQLPRCGDNVRDNLAGEVCDDGNIASGDNCSADCRSLETCGNSIVDTAKGEQCDAGGMNSNLPNAPCRALCGLPRCGDLIVDNLTLGEGCDLGAANSNAPDATCRTSCQPQRCGDNIIDVGRGEVCDDGNAISGDNCSADCKSLETCGNSIVDLAKNEQCDDGNQVNLDQCHDNCTAPRCGDGLVDFNEQCDLGMGGNSNAPNALCRATCQLPRCGDNVVDTLAEACDDGNLVAGDGCTPDCMSNETCGNQVVDLVRGEQCDDGNPQGRDGCSACKLEDAVVLQPGATPNGRAYHAMAYDAARRRVVLFGGYNGANLADTWEWDGVSWTQMKPRRSPGGRYFHAMAYDPDRQRVVLFGGYNNQPRGDTWEWDGVDWVDKSPAASPSPRYFHDLAFDPIRGKLLLYGGYVNGGDNLVTYEWTGSTWSTVPTGINPGSRAGHRMVLDTNRNEILLHGGNSNRTWIWNGSTWVDKGVAPAGVSTTNQLPMAYDPIRARVVLAFSTVTPAVRSWEWNGASSTWAEVLGTSPPNRQYSAAVWDAARSQMVMFGGSGSLSDTWLRTGIAWAQAAPFVQPPAVWRAAAGYDPLRKRVVLFGGTTSCATCGAAHDRTWEWDGRRWTDVAAMNSPSPRSGGTLDFNTQSRTLMLFGGVDHSGSPDQRMYQFDGASWSVAPLSDGAPGSLRGACMAYDRNANSVTTFGGLDQSVWSVTAQTWTWNAAGGWNLNGPATSPPARFNTACSYDPVRRRTVLFGGFSDSWSLLGDVWEWNGATWSDGNAAGPSPRRGHSVVYNPDLRRTLVFGSSSVGTEDLWEWSGTAWTQRALDLSLPERYRAAVSYDAARHALVTLGGRDSSGIAGVTTQLIQYRPYTAVEACTSATMDYDRDGFAGCADADCWSVCKPLCPPGDATCTGTGPRCGDGTCGAFEDCGICPSDCGTCTGGVCGDFTCAVGETSASCPNDC